MNTQEYNGYKIKEIVVSVKLIGENTPLIAQLDMIDVNKMMPELYTPVILYDSLLGKACYGELVNINGKGTHIENQWNIVSLTGGVLYYNKHTKTFDRITHWMPLPKPYEGEEL